MSAYVTEKRNVYTYEKSLKQETSIGEPVKFVVVSGTAFFVNFIYNVDMML